MELEADGPSFTARTSIYSMRVKTPGQPERDETRIQCADGVKAGSTASGGAGRPGRGSADDRCLAATE